jgi:hypothetical protein
LRASGGMTFSQYVSSEVTSSRKPSLPSLCPSLCSQDPWCLQIANPHNTAIDFVTVCLA